MRQSAVGSRQSEVAMADPEVSMPEHKIKSYRDLRVWHEAMDIVEKCYRLTADFPRDEIYGLTSQVRRAAVSVPANIAEGYGRDNTGSYIYFLKIAQGSLKEVETLLLVAERITLIPANSTEGLLAQCDVTGRMLNGLIRSLERDSS